MYWNTKLPANDFVHFKKTVVLHVRREPLSFQEQHALVWNGVLQKMEFRAGKF